jgi:hypothetical protein
MKTYLSGEGKGKGKAVSPFNEVPSNAEESTA